MSQYTIFVSIFFVFLLIVQFLDARRYNNRGLESADDSDKAYRLLKRILSSQSGIGSTQRPPSVLNSLVYPASTAKSPVSSQQSTNSPSYPSSSACASHACEHGSICIAKGQYTYDCKCVGPWRGIYCGIPDACYRSPCQNGGTCLNVHDDYWCQCTKEYYGNNCQTKYHSSTYTNDHCRPYICNTGQCISLQTTYYCQCPNDRYGEHCEKNFYKRNIDSYQSYQNVLRELKRGIFKKDANKKRVSQNNNEIFS
ncbi:hypothetical protein I4U23_020983 [Adineta vaga]|nr:hypothetical protein I4U23_020983 [Adineta vaga]